jgi:hypothetical protein
LPNQWAGVDGLANKLENVVVIEGRGHGSTYPPLTGGRKATSSPGRSGVSHEANS